MSGGPDSDLGRPSLHCVKSRGSWPETQGAGQVRPDHAAETQVWRSRRPAGERWPRVLREQQSNGRVQAKAHLSLCFRKCHLVAF